MIDLDLLLPSLSREGLGVGLIFLRRQECRRSYHSVCLISCDVCTPGRGLRQHSEGMSDMSEANERFPS